VRISAVYAAMAWFVNKRQSFSKKRHSEYPKYKNQEKTPAMIPISTVIEEKNSLKSRQNH